MASWDQKLLKAAREGNIKEVELCVKNGANLEYKDGWGRTPLLWAAWGGHLEVVTYLVTHGSQLDVTDRAEEKTPLMWAAEGGHLEVVMYLTSNGSQLEATSRGALTALHWAAKYGQIETTKWLIDQGCSPWVKSLKGQTPYDLVTIESYDSEEKKRKKKEVMDFLKTVMSKTPPELTPDNQSQEPAAPVVGDSIGNGQQSAMLNRLLGKGSYESFDMRCMVTGQFSAGKSTLVKLLAGDAIPDGRHPTDGISLDLETKEWIPIDPDSYNALDVVYNKVLMASLEEEEESELATKFNKASDTSPTGYTKALLSSLPSEQSAAAQSLPPKKSSNVPLTVKQMEKKRRTRMTKEEIKKKMEKVLKSGKYKMKVGRLIFWDFGGQYVYLTTHQTFMTFRALYLVVFDGSKDLHEQVPDVLCFPGQHMTPTPAVILQYWVNSILTYCKAVYAGIPKILFVATHKDKVPRENVETRREELYKGIEELFKDHEGQHHLVLRPLIFVNAKDQADPEIEVLKKTITELTFDHPCWGERMPNACVPLELEIAELVAEGKQIMSLAEVKELNAISEVSVLSAEQLTDFLHFQHSLGKIVYFDTPQLRDTVIISPLLMVEVMRSFITDVEFWPKEDNTRKTFTKMSENGMIQKLDLYKIWEQEEFCQILPFKDYIFDMLIHLDIISKQQINDTNTGIQLPIENFFVPCMLTQRNNTDFLTQECTPERTLSLAFIFKGTIILPALPNRLICACLSMWTLKEYQGQKLMFSGFVGLSIDKEHDIVVCVEGNKILLYLVHKRSKGLIIPEIASSVKEFLHSTLERISEFYQSTVHKKVSCQLPFHIEYSCSRFICYIPEERIDLKTDECVCNHGDNIKLNWKVWNHEQTESELLLYRLKRMEPNDFKIFIAHGEYESFENRVYLAGACNVGKSCLASILIGEKISKKWNSTNGLTIYFGRNGIQLEDKKMVTLGKSDTSIMKKLLLGNPNIALKKERNVEKPRNFNEEATDHKDSALESSKLKTVDKEIDKKQENKSPSKTKDENPTVPSMTENVKTNLPYYPKMHPKHKALTIQSDILEEIRTGEYKIRIAPSDLVDFGGQRCFDMTHQLFIQHKGTFVLMFDGRYELHKPLDEYPQGETGKDILVHWVNSILVYCKEDDDLLPMIMFAATHSDLLEMDEMLAKERTFTLELSKLFSTHVKNRHILYDKVFFINATNSKDPQIEHLKEKLVDIAFQQSTWGQRMPISWVPLELQISEMRTNNFSVIPKETIQELNRLNDEFSMPEDLIDKFLKIQHSLGKILYFNFQGLDNFIVVQPTVMVNILRSFITDKMFWPEQQDLRSILENAANTGTIQKLQLFKLWSQPPFNNYLPNDQYKEYIINVLVHLDILVRPKHESRVKSDPLYMVPCVVQNKLPEDLFPREEQKTICLAYHLKECAIPSALIFKLIAAAVIIWPLKEIDGRPCLFFQSAVLNIDDNNQLLITVKGQRVIVFLTNRISKHLISPDVTASIQECMTSALQRVLHFYHECFGQTSIKIDEVSLFEIEVGLLCNQEPCLVSLEYAKSKKGWVCENTSNKIKHDTKYCLYWIFKKKEALVVQTNTCSLECKGLSTETLSPSNHQLVQIVDEISITNFRPFIICLGLTVKKWEDILYQYDVNGLMGVKLMAMYELKTEKETISQQVRFKDLWKSLNFIEIWPHYLCQILKEDSNLIDTDSSTLQEIPSDEVLKLLSREMGNCIIQLGLELGLSFTSIQDTMYKYPKDMYEQLYDILKKWKLSSEPTVLNLIKALKQIQSGGIKFLQEQYKLN